MRSRAELRVAAEWVARVALIAVLAIALWHATRGAAVGSISRTVKASSLARGLAPLAADVTVNAVDVDIDAMPSNAERALLVAMRRAGVAVHWHGTPAVLAIEATRVREPDNRARMLVVSGSVAPVALVDSAGGLDTVHAGSGATVDAEATVGDVRAEQGRFAARAAPSLSSPRRAVLVLGRPDWESKFVIAALTESGWTVRASIPVAPGVVIRDEGILPIDTARYDAVVALDSSASELAPAIARFVAEGGGLVAEGSALSLDAFRSLAPARADERVPGRILLAEDTVTRRDLPLRPLSALRADAMALERQAAGPSLAARRAGLGRVLAVGYDETWRWRMLGGVSGLSAHRRWWSAAVGSVAPERAVPAASNGSAAPVAALVSALGRPAAPSSEGTRESRNPLPLILMLVVAAALLAETASRRFRGLR
ncbi:hypothetical protein BH09GEM1_BH09GEM1_21220 [soil metagenome]